MSTNLLLIIILSLASFLQGVTGFGFALIAAPLTALLVGPLNSVVLFTLISLIINFQLILTIKGHAQRNILAPLLIGSALGLPIGLTILTVAPKEALLMAISWITLGFAIAMLALKPQIKPTKLKNIAVGILLGTLHSSVGVNGPPFVLYLSAIKLSPASYRKTLAIFFLITSLLATPLFLSKNLITQSSLLQAGLSIPGIILATALGNRVSSHLPKKVFRGIMYLLILISALPNLIR